MAQWQQVVGEGWVQWANLRLSDSWFLRAQQLTRMESVGNIEAQKQRTKDAWQAFGNACRAIDTPPYNIPAFRATWKRYYGTHGFGTIPNDPSSFWTDGTALPNGSIFEREAQRLYTSQRPNGADVILFKVRYGITGDGIAFDTCEDPSGGCYSPPPYWMTDTTDPRQTSAETDWNNWGFWDGGPFAWLSAVFVGKVLPPVRWSMTVLKEIVDQCVALGALEILTEARLYAVLLNFQMASRYHLLTNDALLRAAALLPADIEANRWSNEPGSNKAVGQQIIQAGSAIGGEYGLLIGAGGQVVSWLPTAAGYNSDMFGRAEPVYEHPNISGGAGPYNGPQRLSIPDPPGYIPQRYVTLPLVLPPMGGTAVCAPPDEFFSAESRLAWMREHPSCAEPPPFVEKAGFGAVALAAVFLAAIWKIFTR